MFSPQLQQREEPLPISNGIAIAHLDIGLKTLSHVHESGSRAGMQSGLVEDHSIEEVCIISFNLLRGRCRRSLTSQSFDDITRISRLSQACHLLLVAQHPGEPSQHFNVFVRSSSDPHHKLDRLSLIPRHSRGYLHYCNSSTLN